MSSGRESELLPCKITPSALHALSDQSGATPDAVTAAFSFLASANLPLVAQAMHGRKLPESVRRLRERISDTFHEISTTCRPCLDPYLIFHPRNALHRYFDGENVRIAIDTVPIYVDDGPRMFQKKYGEAVVKVLVATTFTGYIVFVSPLYTGTSPDNLIFAHCGIQDKLRELGVMALADGAFASDILLKPPTRPAIWKKYLIGNETVQDWRQHAHSQLKKVQLHSHFRSRVEHAFSRARMGRFIAFKNFHCFDYKMLENAFVSAAAAVNAEIFARHEARGCYPPIDPEYVSTVVERHVRASQRYPEPAQLPKRKTSPANAATAARRQRARREEQQAVSLATRDYFEETVKRLSAKYCK
jgi:hypothetical protein